MNAVRGQARVLPESRWNVKPRYIETNFHMRRRTGLVKTTTLDDLIEEFEFVDSDDRTKLIIEFGDELEFMPDALKTEQHRVQGCISNVWLVMAPPSGDPPVIQFMADSDSQIVRGLVAILVMLCSGRTGAEILELDIKQVFERLNLKRYISRARSNGFYSMVKRIESLAEQYA